MSGDQYRTREAAKQQVRPPPSQSSSPAPGGPPSPPGDPSRPGRRAWLFGAIAAVAAVAVGGTVLMSGGGTGTAGAGQFEFTVTTDPQQVLDYLHHQTSLPPAKEQKLEEQAERQELVIWHVKQRPGWSGQEGQTYTMDNGIDQYQFAIRSEGLDFGVFAEKSTTGFSFSADSNPGKAKMVGTWYTPAGQTRFNMQPGQTMMVPVK